MSKNNMFTPEEFLQERNLNSYYEQDRIRKRVLEYKPIIANTQHYLEQVQQSCTHPYINEFKYCSDCGKDLNG